jgi:hypothetical protein
VKESGLLPTAHAIARKSVRSLSSWPFEIEGEPRALEHDELRWVTLVETRAMKLAPADAALVQRPGS